MVHDEDSIRTGPFLIWLPSISAYSPSYSDVDKAASLISAWFSRSTEPLRVVCYFRASLSPLLRSSTQFELPDFSTR